MTSGSIRLLLVDDHALFREALHALLDGQEGLEVVGEAASGEQAVALAEELAPDIVLMDVSMPGMSGIEATEIILRTSPAVRILGLTVHETTEYFSRMLAAGASGYVVKGATGTELVTAIRSVALGGMFISAGVAAHLERCCKSNVEPVLHRKEGDGLTSREHEILDLLARGMTNHAIASLLHLSVSTVQSHRANIIRKLGLESGQQLILYALRKGYAHTES